MKSGIAKADVSKVYPAQIMHNHCAEFNKPVWPFTVTALARRTTTKKWNVEVIFS